MSRSVAAVAGGVALAVALALLPGPGRRLAQIPGDGPDPRYDAPLPAERVRQAARELPDDARYLLLAPGAAPLAAGNVKAAAQLFFAPAVPVQDPRLADWRVVYAGRAFTLRRLR